jgi:hypothetical protein
MEELLSTDSIHREILDDAKRKATKILNGAENTVVAVSAEWNAKLQKAVDQVKKRYETDLAEKKTESWARLAMDKARAKLSKVTGELDNAMTAFFQSLSRKEILDILEHALSVRIDNVKSAALPLFNAGFSQLQVQAYGLGKDEAETLLSHLSLTAVQIDRREISGDELPSIVLLAGDIKITASIQAEAEAVLLSKRSEAAEVLFG